MSFMGAQAFTGVSYDELVAQYSQAVAAASSAAFNQSTLARKVRCAWLESRCCTWLYLDSACIFVALPHIEPLASRIVAGKSKEVPMILGGFPHRRKSPIGSIFSAATVNFKVNIFTLVGPL
jgi:hypothetical protein